MNPARFFRAIRTQRCSERLHGDLFCVIFLEILETLGVLEILEILNYAIFFSAFLGLGSVTVESGMFFLLRFALDDAPNSLTATRFHFFVSNPER